MSNPVQGFVVILDTDIHEDAVKDFVQAIRMLKHVHSVMPLEVEIDALIARERTRIEYVQALTKAIRNILNGKAGDDGKAGDAR